jgi:myo-inositol 2-dehydrogenase/D-chiro-inositol 1-dehydrogenase
MAAWLEFVRGERENPCPAEEAFHALRVAVAAERSLAEKRVVALSEISAE